MGILRKDAAFCAKMRHFESEFTRNVSRRIHWSAVIISENTTFGGFLRTLRTSKRLTMEQATQQAGIHRATLDRWEKGRAQPYLPELNALLVALDASEPQKRKALDLMDAPRAARQIRQEVTQIAEQSGIGFLPHGGDLLRALRMRQGLSLEAAARRIQVTGGTLRRWEKMEVWPSLGQLHRLCYALEAQEEEIVALTVGRFSQRPRVGKVSLDSLQERLAGIKALEHRQGNYSLFELALLQLEADAWPLALRSASGKQMLIEIYSFHTQRLSMRERLTEANTVAERALELMTGRLKPQRFWLYPVLVSARASAFRGAQSAPQRAVEILRPWLSTVQWPEMQAWLLADMAKYIGLLGEQNTALTLADQACRVAEKEGDAGELCLRRWDKASLLLRAERPRDAFVILEKIEDIEDLPECRIEVSLLRAEAYLAVDDSMQAQDWLQRALTDIDTYHIDQRPRFDKLAAQL